jgi:hypothetical protein
VIVAICASILATQNLTQSAETFTQNVLALFLIFLVNAMLYAWIPWLLLMRRVPSCGCCRQPP